MHPHPSHAGGSHLRVARTWSWSVSWVWTYSCRLGSRTSLASGACVCRSVNIALRSRLAPLSRPEITVPSGTTNSSRYPRVYQYWPRSSTTCSTSTVCTHYRRYAVPVPRYMYSNMYTCTWYTYRTTSRSSRIPTSAHEHAIKPKPSLLLARDSPTTGSRNS